jgi:hypothetical protein
MPPRKKAEAGSPVGAARPVEPTGEETSLGTFSKRPVVFTVYEAPVKTDEGSEYRVYGDDGAGPRLICWFTDDSEAAPGVFRSACRPRGSRRGPLQVGDHPQPPRADGPSHPDPHHTPHRTDMLFDM